MNLRQRQPRVEDAAFLAFVRGHRCCVCGAPPRVQAAHIRMGSRAHQKRQTGTGEKPDDRWSVPLCASCHLDGPGALHKVGEERFWRFCNVDPFALARALYSAFLKSDASESGPKARRPKLKRARPVKHHVANRGKNKTSRPLQSANRWPPKGSRKIGRQR